MLFSFRTKLAIPTLCTSFLLALGCGNIENPNYTADGGAGADASGGDSSNEFACDPIGDDDNDCISNASEGCLLAPPADRDLDGLPDYQDEDSDSDGILDRIEVGTDCSSPRDTDSDGLPNYLDTDSDNDGALDQHEDRNFDGQIGTCSGLCVDNGDCIVAEGQTCSRPIDAESGTCVAFACSEGESDPYNPDTDGDFIPDGLEGTYICNPTSEFNPDGLKNIKYADSQNTNYPGGNWRVALELDAQEGAPNIISAGALDSAYVFDLSDPDIEVAGFIGSRASTFASALDESQDALRLIGNLFEVQSATTRVSGTPRTSLDDFDTVVNTTIDISTVSTMDVVALRALVLPALLNRTAAEIVVANPGWGGEQAQNFTVTYQTVFRQLTGQTLYQGAVTRRAAYDNRERLTSIHASDMSNGTGHSVSGNQEAVECEQTIADQLPIADIIWVVDESGSMDDEREALGAAAMQFVGLALNAGLDFRMGITDMRRGGPGGQPGIFATREAQGTGDRWLFPTEFDEFNAAIQAPSGPDPADFGTENGLTQGRDAIERHTPRDDNNPQMVRESAQLVIIYATDEAAQEIKSPSSCGSITASGGPSQDTLDCIAQTAQPFIDHLHSHDAVAHVIGEPLPHKSNPCATEHAYGYYEAVAATSGQVGSICQLDFTATVTGIIDSIIGAASPVTLEHFPISASISVVRDSLFVQRSRNVGWDYRGDANSIVFFNLPLDPETPAELVISYRRWKEQVPPQ